MREIVSLRQMNSFQLNINMAFHSEKETVQYLIELCVAKQIRHVVVSPGSRNAPLALSFNSRSEFQTHVMVDERSAGFFALGIAQQTGKPVIAVCTSGSAVLNYAPSIVEAYYQQIPLVIVSADRPQEWIDQNDGQTIRQRGVLSDFFQKNVHLPADINSGDERWYAARLMNEALNAARFPIPGPVHINMPFKEPLYKTSVTGKHALPKNIQTEEPEPALSDESWQELEKAFKNYNKVLVIAGCLNPSSELNTLVNTFSGFSQVSIFTETTSNLQGKNFNPSIDNLLFSFADEKDEIKHSPDLLITFGGQVVSKRIKAFLRKHPIDAHWHIHPNALNIDTYKALTKNIPVKASAFFEKATHWKNIKSSGYKNLWQEREKTSRKRHETFVRKATFSDLTVFQSIFKYVPENCILHFGNSTPIRYSQLFLMKKGVSCYANRGTSGIDGTVSTAVGAATAAPEKQHYLITGDLAFFYDSNGLWTDRLPENLGIILINNSGGGIFRIIEGPEDNAHTRRLLETRHQLNAEGIASTFGIDYQSCNTEKDLNTAMKVFFENQQKRCKLLEIFTPPEVNDRVLKNYIQFLKTGE